MRKLHIVGTLTTLVAATPRTLLQLVSAGEAMSIIEAAVSFQGGANGDDASVLVEMVRQTGAGTSVAAVVAPSDPSWPETLRATARSTFSSTEPGTLALSAIDQVFAPRLVHPKGGIYTFRWAPDEMIVGGTGSNTRLGLRVTPPAALSVTTKAIASFIVLGH